MRLDFGYGTGIQTVEIPDENLLGVLTANEIPHERGGFAPCDTRWRTPSAQSRCGSW